MKALTLTQPWATAIAIGRKRVETRSWSTQYRGRLLIHAAKGLKSVGGKGGLCDLVTDDFEDLFPVSAMEIRRGRPVEELFPLGAVVAMVNLIGCVPTRGLDVERLRQSSTDLRLGNFQPGRFAWHLEDVDAFNPPIPARGELGLWTPADEVFEQLPTVLA